MKARKAADMAAIDVFIFFGDFVIASMEERRNECIFAFLFYFTPIDTRDLQS